MDGNVKIEVDQDLVRPIIEQEIHTAIVAQLGGSAEIMSKIVSKVLSMKVDSKGEFTKGGYRDDKEYVVWLAEKAIKESAKKAVASWVAAKEEEITAEIEKQMKTKTKSLAKDLIFNFAESVKNDYKVNVNLNFDQKYS